MVRFLLYAFGNGFFDVSRLNVWFYGLCCAVLCTFTRLQVYGVVFVWRCVLFSHLCVGKDFGVAW